VPDARRQGVTKEAYKSYSAGRNDRHTPQGETTEVNVAGGTLKKDQGCFLTLTNKNDSYI